MIQTTSARGKHYIYKGLKIYPIKIKDLEEFHWAIECLAVSKNSNNDLKILTMTYLEFLKMLIEESLDFKLRFELLCELVFKTDQYEFEKDEYGRWQLVFNKMIVINAEEFDKLKDIIAQQNVLDLSDEFVAPEVRNKLNETREFLNKQSENKVAKLDQQIIAYHCASGLSYDEIDELTFYQFQKGLARFDHMFNAQANLTGIYSGMRSLEKGEKIPNWLDNISDKVKDSDLKVNPDEFKKKAMNQGMTNK